MKAKDLMKMLELLEVAVRIEHYDPYRFYGVIDDMSYDEAQMIHKKIFALVSEIKDMVSEDE